MKYLKKTSHKIALAVVITAVAVYVLKPQIDQVLAQLPFGAPAAAPVATAAYTPFN